MTAMRDQDDRREALDALRQGLFANFLGPRVRVLWNLLSARMATALAPFGLRSGAFSTLTLIATNPGISQNELARGLGIDKSAVVAIIDDLEQRGLARRLRSPADRRRHALSLTAQGEAMMERMRGPVAEVGLPIRAALSMEEMDQLLLLLDRAYHALQDGDLAKAESAPAARPAGTKPLVQF